MDLEKIKDQCRRALETSRGDGFAEIALELARRLEKLDLNLDIEKKAPEPEPVDDPEPEPELSDENHVDEKPKRKRRARGDVS